VFVPRQAAANRAVSARLGRATNAARGRTTAHPTIGQRTRFRAKPLHTAGSARPGRPRHSPEPRRRQSRSQGDLVLPSRRPRLAETARRRAIQAANARHSAVSQRRHPPSLPTRFQVWPKHPRPNWTPPDWKPIQIQCPRRGIWRLGVLLRRGRDGPRLKRVPGVSRPHRRWQRLRNRPRRPHPRLRLLLRLGHAGALARFVRSMPWRLRISLRGRRTVRAPCPFCNLRNHRGPVRIRPRWPRLRSPLAPLRIPRLRQGNRWKRTERRVRRSARTIPSTTPRR
jgi:hypothetical protein